MVWAFDCAHGGLLRIGPGQADALRVRAKSGELVCPVGDCPSPTLTTRRGYTTAAGTNVSDGFRHRVAPTPAHEPESQLHITGKLVVALWLGCTGWSDVQLERHDTQAHRTPDVSASRAGRKLAVEVQYAQLTVDQWSQRTNDLTSAGFDVLWLWGKRRPPGERSMMIPTSAVHAEMLRRRLPIVWFDPETDAFGTSAGVRKLKHSGHTTATAHLIVPEPGDRSLRVRWHPTASTRFIDGELWHTDIDRLRRTTEYVRRVRLHQLGSCINQLVCRRSEARHVNAEGRVTTDAGGPYAGSGAASSVLNRPFTPPAVGPAPTARIRPVPAERALLEQNGLGPAVDAVYAGDSHVYGPPSDWHGALALRLLRRDIGATIAVSSIASYVENHTQCETGRGRTAIAGLLSRLEELGWIKLEGPYASVRRRLPPDASGE